MSPACDRLREVTYHLEGYVAPYLRGVSEQWLKVAPSANPAMLEMLRDRDRRPYRDLVPWAGEFAGKYLTAAVQVLRLTRDPELEAYLARFVQELIVLQAADGYLGPWPREYALSGRAPQLPDQPTWDAWGHYHVMLGLLLWSEHSGDPAALACAARIGDLFCTTFLGDRHPRLVDTGATEMNLAPIHALCLLYHTTHVGRYLELATQIAGEFAVRDAVGTPLAGDYVNAALAGKEFFETPKPRWESLHPLIGLGELSYITGDETYCRAVEHFWWSIVRLDRHNNGGFSSGEQAQGNPYHQGAIETCCTIAWIALSVEMLRLTGASIIADELELSTLNSVIGAHGQAGRWATYNTPMDGVRVASAQEIVFQARAGAPELNCCSVNAARGLGMIGDWALMGDADGLILNWYGPGTMAAPLPSGTAVRLVQETAYPRNGAIVLRVEPSRAEEFTLKLRIPSWSAATRVVLNGQEIAGACSGAYLVIRRTWQASDTVEIALDMSLHYWAGEQEVAGKTSIYRGPLLLTYDRRFNAMDPDTLPALDARTLTGRIVSWDGWIAPYLVLECPVEDGQVVRLCDFGSAGEGGTPYRSWLPVRHVAHVPFSRTHPLPSGRVQEPA